MNEDKLKDLIKTAREEFEQDGPREGLWDGIQDALHGDAQQHRHKPLIKWAIAAAVAAAVAISAWLLMKEHVAPQQELFSTEALEPQYLSEDLAEVDRYYASQVSEKTNELAKYEVDPELMEEVVILNEEFLVLKAEMGQGMDDNKVVEAMIENYRLRLSLLEDLMQALAPETASTSTKNEEHEL